MPSAPRTHPNMLRAFSSYWTDSDRVDDLLTQEEQDFVAVAVREIRRRSGEVKPAVVMRLEGVIVLYVLARRAGLAALRTGLAGMDAVDARRDSKMSSADDVCKAQDHLRKALKDLEDALGDGETAVARGVADLLRPLLKDTDGLAELVANEKRDEDESRSHDSRVRDTLPSKIRTV